MCVLGVRRAREPGWIRATWECCGDTKVLLWDQITLLCCQNGGGAAVPPGAEKLWVHWVTLPDSPAKGAGGDTGR